MLDFLKHNKYILIFSFFFIILSGSLIFNSGYKSCETSGCSYYFSEWQMHDALWHISLAKLAFDSYPFTNPFYSGANLSGYNYFLDLVLYGMQFFKIDAIIGYFFVLPTLAIIFYLYSSWIFLRDYCSSLFERYLASFFLYFATSLSYLATLFSSSTLNGATLRGFPVVTSLHPPSMLLNLPYAFSLPILLYILVWLKKNPSKSSPLLFLVLAFLVFGLKFYAGIVLIILVVMCSNIRVILGRTIGLIIGTLSAYLLFYFHGELGFPFVYDPLALVHLMIDDIHLFYNHSQTLARYYLYENLSTFPVRLIAIEVFSIILFLTLNIGTKMLSFFFLRSIKKLSKIDKVILLLSLFLTLIPILFVQKGGWYNTMQFMYYSSFLLSLATVKILSVIYQNRPKKAVIVGLIITLPLIPTTLEQLNYYFLPKNQVGIDEVNALITLKSYPDGVVHVNRPWAKRALIPALAEKRMYYLDSDQLMLMSNKHTERLDLVRKYDGGSIAEIPADYFYIYHDEVASPDSLKSLRQNPGFVVIYESGNITIFYRLKPGDTII